jgi:hypothetical protein
MMNCYRQFLPQGELMMKKIGVIAFALIFIGSGMAMASPVVPPPVELDTISTVTNIQCVGTVLEAESYTRRWIGATDGDPGPQIVGQTIDDPFEPDEYVGVPLNENDVPVTGAPTGYLDPPTPENIAIEAPGSDVGGPGRAPTLGAGDTAGEIRYTEEFNAIGGQTAYNKLFDTDTGGTPVDLDVDKTFTYAAVDPNGNLSFNERVGLTVVSNGFDIADAAPPVTDVIGGLCPWVQDPGGTITEIPATNELVAMGSEILSAGAVQANTATSVGASDQSPNANYAISAQGEGFIEASMAAQIQEGFNKVGWAPTGNRIFTGQQALVGLQPAELDAEGNIVAVNDQPEIDAIYADPDNYKYAGTVVAPGLALFEQYEETSSANGQWLFEKSMAYQSQIPVLQQPTPFNQ